MIQLNTYLIIVFCAVSLSVTSQTNHQKIKDYFQAKNYSLVLEETSHLKSSEPLFDSILFLKSYSLLKLGKIKDAQVACEQLIKFNSNFTEVYFLKGLISASKENYFDAIYHFNKILEKNPNHQKALYNLALSKGMIEDYKSAIKDLTKCIELNPNYALAYYNRAYWYELTEQVDFSIADYTKAIEIDHHYSEAYFALAYLYADKKGDIEKACSIMNQAKNEGIESANDILSNYCK